MCLDDGFHSDDDRQTFRDLCRMLQSVFHFEYHDLLESLKDAYAPLNRDRDTREVRVGKPGDAEAFAAALKSLLNTANYEELEASALEAALEEASLFQIKLKVDFSDFEEVLIYTRGESEHEEQVSTFFGLIKRNITFINFDRVVIFLRYRVADGDRSGTTMLKMFQNVPRADVEMLFPNTRLGMRNIDKLMIGVPAVIGAGAIITTKVGTSLLLLGSLVGFWLGLHSEAVELDEARMAAILAGLGGLGSYIWKQFSNFKNRKLLFMQSLTQNLYFKNLDNNAGVFHRLIDDAEEEECKEAILAYYFLLKAEATIEELDARIELWFRESWQAEVDFEIEDALGKLERLGLVTRDGENYVGVTMSDALTRLDERWDDYFSYANTGSE